MKKGIKALSCVFGFITGIINGLLGAGGGMVAVPMLNRQIETKNAHATSLAIILPICITSAISYFLSGKVAFEDATPYMWWGLIGALIGTWLLKKLNDTILKKVFAIFMLWAGVRLIMR